MPSEAKGTLEIGRDLRAPPERVYGAFLDPDALAKWIPPAGYTGHVYHMEPRVGGTYRMSFSSLDRKETHTFGGTYVELEPGRRIRYTDAFETEAPEMKGPMDVTITFERVTGGTRLHVVQAGIPSAIPVEMARAGWTSSLENLARLVELPEPPSR